MMNIKPTLTLILALLIVTSVRAQNIFGPHTHTVIKTAQLFFEADTPKVIKRDTIRCYFKELEVNHDTITEHWRHGYQVIDTMGSYHYTGVWETMEHDTQLECYLYPDRKTKVTNQVIYSISSK
jgi:hypothetical protein